MTDFVWKPLKYFLGLEIASSTEGIYVCQRNQRSSRQFLSFLSPDPSSSLAFSSFFFSLLCFSSSKSEHSVFFILKRIWHLFYPSKYFDTIAQLRQIGQQKIKITTILEKKTTLNPQKKFTNEKVIQTFSFFQYLKVVFAFYNFVNKCIVNSTYISIKLQDIYTYMNEMFATIYVCNHFVVINKHTFIVLIRQNLQLEEIPLIKYINITFFICIFMLTKININLIEWIKRKLS